MESDSRQFPYVLFSAPPSGSSDYPAEVQPSSVLLLLCVPVPMPDPVCMWPAGLMISVLNGLMMCPKAVHAQTDRFSCYCLELHLATGTTSLSFAIIA